jgi:hypothetical protein
MTSCEDSALPAGALCQAGFYCAGSTSEPVLCPAERGNFCPEGEICLPFSQAIFPEFNVFNFNPWHVHLDAKTFITQNIIHIYTLLCAFYRQLRFVFLTPSLVLKFELTVCQALRLKAVKFARSVFFAEVAHQAQHHVQQILDGFAIQGADLSMVRSVQPVSTVLGVMKIKHIVVLTQENIAQRGHVLQMECSVHQDFTAQVARQTNCSVRR